MSNFEHRTPLAADVSNVTVIIPAYNAQSTILNTLDAILQQTLPPKAVFVVDDGSTDNTAETVRNHSPSVTIIQQSNAGPAAARNAGIKLAVTEFIGFTDSDCRPSATWLAELLVGFDSAMVAGVGGRVRGIGTDLISRYVDSTHMLDPGVTKNGVEFLVTANACFRRQALIQVGLFSEEFRKPGGEEPELCERLRLAGYELRAVNDAWVQHRHKQTIGVLLKTLANYGEGRFILAKNIPKYIWSPRPQLALVRHLLGIRMVIGGIRQRRVEVGMKTAATYSVLKYLCDAAFLWGYGRAQRQHRRSLVRK